MSSAKGVRFTVRLTPRAARNSIDGVGPDGELRVRIHAAPVDGAANEALARILAETLSVARTKINIVRGASSRIKLVEVHGADPDALRAVWEGLLVSG